MKKSINSVLNMISLNFDCNTLTSFFNEQFNNLQTNQHVDLMTFNNYTGMPLIISGKVFQSFKKGKSAALTQKEFCKGMTKLYSSSYATRLKLIFNILDYNKKQLIHKEDIKLFLLHFHLITNKTDFHLIEKQLDILFQEAKEITLKTWINSIEKKTSDIALLLLFFFHQYLPVQVACIEFYNNITNNHIEEKEEGKTSKKDKSTFSRFQQVFNKKNGFLKHHGPNKSKEEYTCEFIEPSQFFYDYMNFHMDIRFFSIETSDSINDEDNSDLEELMSFEENISEITSSISGVESISQMHFRLMNELMPNSIRNSDSHIKKMANHLEIDMDLKHNSSFNLDASQHESHFHIKKYYSNSDKNNKTSALLLEMASNNTNDSFFTSQCLITNSEQMDLNTTVIILGNMLFTQRKPNPKDEQEENGPPLTAGFERMIPLNRLFVQKKSNKTEEDSMTVIMVSTIKGRTDTYCLKFTEKKSAEKFIAIVHHKTNYRRLIDEYDARDHTIGFGCSGIVKLIKKKNSNELYAVKLLSINYASQYEMQLVYNELDICKSLMKTTTTNLVQFHDYFENVDTIFIVMEYIQGLTLEAYMETKPGEFKRNKRNLSLQLINILQTLQFYGIIHRDIKTENIMIPYNKYTTSRECQAKLIDFGFSKVICQAETLNDSLGTIPFACPEIIMNIDYSYKLDVWSLGVILYVFLFGELPFNHDITDRTLIMDNIVTKHLHLSTKEVFNETDSLIKIIIEKCLEKDYIRRGSINDIFELWKSIETL